MVRFTCDVTGQPIPPTEASTVRLSGPIRDLAGRGELHLSKPVAAALVRWLGRRDVTCPELEELAGVEHLDALA